jgi:hypothetical protein
MIGVFGEPVHAPNGERGVLPISGEIAEVAPSAPVACLPLRDVSTARGLGLFLLGELEVDLSDGEGECSRDWEESLPLTGVEGLGRRRSSGIVCAGQRWKESV